MSALFGEGVVQNWIIGRLRDPYTHLLPRVQRRHRGRTSPAGSMAPSSATTTTWRRRRERERGAEGGGQRPLPPRRHLASNSRSLGGLIKILHKYITAPLGSKSHF